MQQTIAVQIGRTVLSFNVRVNHTMHISEGNQRFKDITKIKPENRTTTDNIMFYQKLKHNDNDEDIMGVNNGDGGDADGDDMINDPYTTPNMNDIGIIDSS